MKRSANFSNNLAIISCMRVQYKQILMMRPNPLTPSTKTRRASTHSAARRQHAFGMYEGPEALRAGAKAQESLPNLVGCVLDYAVSHNDQIVQAHAAAPVPSQVLPFEGADPCPLCPSRYIERIMRYTMCSPSCLIVAIVYLQRLKDIAQQRGEGPLLLTSFNLQRMFLTALMIAHKFLDEPFCSNKMWGLVGEVPLQELNSLELAMLSSLGWRVNVSRSEYDACRCALEARDRRPPAPPRITYQAVQEDEGLLLVASAITISA